MNRSQRRRLMRGSLVLGSSLLLGGLWLIGGAPAYAGCTLTGNGTLMQCDANRILAHPISGDVTLTIDSMTLVNAVNAEIDFYPQSGNVFPPVNATLIITGTTSVNTPNYGAVNFAVAVDNYSLNLQVGAQVVLQSGGGFGGLWVRNDNSGDITIDTAATILVTGAGEDGVTASTNLGRVYLSNSGTVTATDGRGLYADGGFNNPVTDAVPVTILNTGTVNAFQAGIRAIDYQGLALIDNRGRVESTTRQGLVAWSNNGPVTIMNTGLVISHDDNAIHAMTEIGDITVTNGGTVTAANDPAITATRTGYSGIRAEVTTSGNITITNAQAGSLSTNDDAVIAALTPAGNISITNAGIVTGWIGVDASTSSGTLRLVNSGSITTTFDAVRLVGTSNTLDNSGAISAGSGRVSLSGTSNTLVNGGTIRLGNGGVILTGASNALVNSGTISVASAVAAGNAPDSGDAPIAANAAVILTGTSNTLINSGTISAASGAAAGNAPSSGDVSIVASAAVILTGTSNTLVNSGTINAAFGAVSLTGTTNTLDNSGTISAGSGGVILTGTSNTLVNSGTISAASSAATGNAPNSGDASIVVSAAVILTGTSNTLVNSGAINAAFGGVSLTGTSNTLDNSGTIGAALDTVSLSGTGNRLDNSGTITTSGASSHAVLASGGDTVLVNRGVIANAAGIAIALGVGNDQIILEAGSRTIGALQLGAGDDLTLVRAGADVAGVTRFDGEAGNDRLRFEGVTRSGGADILSWEGFELAQGSRLTLTSDLVMGGSDSRTGSVAIDAASTLAVSGNRTIRAADPASLVTVTNAGLIAIASGTAVGNSLTIAGNYVGQGGTVALNAVLGGNGASDRLVISGGRASGATVLRVTLVGATGTTTSDSIRLVETRDGASIDPGAFRLDTRVAAGSFEYRLVQGDGSSGEDLFLRTASAAGVPYYRPEVALYAPVAAAVRQVGLATLASFDARIGEADIRDPSGDGALGKLGEPFGGGAWARAIGERSRSRADGTVDASAIADIVGFQAGFDLLRTGAYGGGHRDVLGVYAAYTDYNATVSGFALGQSGLRVGRLQMDGPSLGAYWTHVGPGGWHVDAVVQASWLDVTARADIGTRMSTDSTGYAASLGAGYPLRLAPGWQVEPQAEVVWQRVSTDGARDAFSSVGWDDGDTVTGRLGARLQYTARTPVAAWQPYAKVNLWHTFSGTDRIRFGASAPIESRYGDTALEVGGGITARVNQSLSVFAHADYRWSLDGGRGRQTATQGSIGIRYSW